MNNESRLLIFIYPIHLKCVCVCGDFYRSMFYLEIFLLTLGKCIFNFLSDVQMVPNLWWFDFMIFQLYDGVRAVWIKQKAYIEF